MLKRSSPPVGAKGNEVKHLANVSCQVTARDPSDATLCQDDTQRGEKASLDNSYIIAFFYKASFVFCSLIRTCSLLCSQKVLSLAEKSQSKLCILLAYSYL